MVNVRTPIPIADLFEAHLCERPQSVDSVLWRATRFAAGACLCGHATLPPFGAKPGEAMLGLWAQTALASSRATHLAFQVELADLHAAPSSLRNGGIKPLDFTAALK